MNIEDLRPANQAARKSALVHVLQKLWAYPLTTKSDDARMFADDIAEAASRGFITTSTIPKGVVFGRLWKLTPEGLSFLFDNAALVKDEETRYVQAYCAN